MYYYRGLNDWAKESDGSVDFFVCHGRVNMENLFNAGEYAIFDYPDLTKYDGAIMIASTINEESVRTKLEDNIRKAGIPCVVMDYEVEGFSRIYIDQERYLNQMVHHLVEKHGKKRLCYIGGLSSNVEANARMSGFLNGMRECGCFIRQDWIFEKQFRFNDGYDVARELLKKPDDFPDGIVCANDDMAAGVCEALREVGMQVGRDCCVTGFDQYFLGQNYAPSITTVRRPREAIAYHACEMLEHYQGVTARKEQAQMYYGQTCGCGDSACKNDAAFRRHVFATYNNRDMFSAMLAHMEESMIAGEEIQQIVESMDTVFARFKEGRCRILLQPELETESITSFATYRTCKREIMLWRGEAEGDEIKGHAYMYAPIHFLNHLYGFCVFRDIPQFLNNKELYNFTKSIGFSIENMMQKRKYTSVNNKLQDLYETDYLTNTYNRHGFAKYADEMLQNARANQQELQVIFIDIDGLKTINDQYGHEAGDVVIRLVGHAVGEIADTHTKVFRYGGDEFLVLHEGEGMFSVFCQKVEEVMQEKRNALHLPYQVGASMGCVIAAPGEQKTLEEYVKEADHLMYAIKQRHHKNRI